MLGTGLARIPGDPDADATVDEAGTEPQPAATTAMMATTTPIQRAGQPETIELASTGPMTCGPSCDLFGAGLRS